MGYPTDTATVEVFESFNLTREAGDRWTTWSGLARCGQLQWTALVADGRERLCGEIHLNRVCGKKADDGLASAHGRSAVRVYC